jgi:C-terminal processing protease CtpA/Prc
MPSSPTPTSRPGPIARVVAAAALAGMLASCGGGGGGGNSGPDPFDIGLPDSDTLAQQCAVPRPGDKQGTLESEKAWLRSWIDETYLWYQDVRGLPAATLDPANSATPLDYFNKLKSTEVTASGKAKDQFHFTYPTPEWIALSQSGISYGYGFQVALVDDTAPDRVAIVAYVEPGTPATAAGIARGTEILEVDGAVVADGTAAVLNAGLFPKSAGSHTFVVRDVGASTTRTVTLTAQSLVSTPVLKVATLPAPNQNVGYILFNDHIATSEAQLVAAIETLKAAAVTDLVLDIRYNGGGYLDIASELAYMIAGPDNTSGKFFERLNYNNRDPFHQSLAERTTYFLNVSQGFSGPRGQSLPSLDLDRVFVLTSPDTCSASEAIINGLRGAGVTVQLVGSPTCGKPYGFYPQDNCGTTYFAIQFQGVNFLGFGDYADGFAATCTVADDFSRELGDPSENQLEVALGLRNTGACTAPTSVRAQALGIGRKIDSGPVLARTPERENRLYRQR